jgi:hypothetical protein
MRLLRPGNGFYTVSYLKGFIDIIKMGFDGVDAYV